MSRLMELLMSSRPGSRSAHGWVKSGYAGRLYYRQPRGTHSRYSVWSFDTNHAAHLNSTFPACLIAALLSLLVAWPNGVAQDQRNSAPSESFPLDGKVTDANDQSIGQAIVEIIPAVPSQAQMPDDPSTVISAAADGRFQIQRRSVPLVIYVHTADQTQAGIARINSTQRKVRVSVGPLASVRGRLLNHRGEVVSKGRIGATVSIYKPAANDGTFPLRRDIGVRPTIGHDGRYELSGLIPGEEYEIVISEPARGRFEKLATVKPARSEKIDVGDTRYTSALTFEEMAADLFRPRGKINERIARVEDEASACFTRVLLFLGDAASSPSLEMVAFCDRNSQLLSRYERLAVSLEDLEAMAEIKRLYGSELAKVQIPVVMVLDEQSKPVGTISLVSDDPKALNRAITEFLSTSAPPLLDAEDLLANALDQARRQDKKVLLNETAQSWKGCGSLSRYLGEYQETLNQYFVVVRINRSRLKHGQEVMNRFRPDRSSGFPWIAILDSDGNRLTDSDGPERKNFRYPRDVEGVDRFLQVLSSAAPSLSAEQLAQLRKGFDKGR